MSDSSQTILRLTDDIFDRICRRFISSIPGISLFAQSGYSFEEWCNWEAYAACSEAPGWRVFPKPRYVDAGVNQCKDFGDILVEVESGNRVLVEIGLVHDYTSNKWLVKLDADMTKLHRVNAPGIETLQIIVLASAKDRIIHEAAVWQRWLQRLKCWNLPASLIVKAPLDPNGQMVIHGWAGASQI